MPVRVNPKNMEHGCSCLGRIREHEPATERRQAAQGINTSLSRINQAITFQESE
nr:hypothetical protein Iba_chr09aCG9740 [Ipomoea batatas]